MKVGLLFSKVRIEEKLILQEFAKLSADVAHINPQDLSLTMEKNDFGGVEILLNREIAQTRAELILEFADQSGIKTVNSAASTKLSNNKALTNYVLTKHAVPTPKTVIAFSAEEALKAANTIGYPLVIKPIWGSWGRLLSKVSSPEVVETILEHKKALSNPSHSIFYLQEYIAKPDRDIRVFMIGDEPICAMYRTSTHWLTNTARGAVAHSMTLDKEATELAIKTVKALGVDVAGVDMVESKDGYKVLEVNATPEFHELKKVAQVNIAELIARYILKQTI